jgi:hypothetical protein
MIIMDNPLLYLTVSLSGLAAIAILAITGLRGFTGWLDLRRAEMALREGNAPVPSATNRIEIADLKERIRKLEAIAAGVDL